jgi:hypothetical protein
MDDKLRVFLYTYLKKTGKLFNLTRNQLRILTGLVTGHCQLKGHLFKLAVIDASRHLTKPHTFFLTVRP